MTTAGGKDGGSSLVARNGLFLLIGQVLTQAISLGLGILIARSLGDALYGRYVAAFAFAAVFASFASMGLDKLVTREVARRPEEVAEVLRDSGLVRLLLVVLVWLAMVAASYVLGFGPDQRLLALLAGLNAVIISFTDFLRSVFQAFERMEFDSITRVLERVVSAVFVLLAIWIWPSVLSVVCSLLAGSLVALVPVIVLTGRFAKPKGKPLLSRGLPLLKMAIPFGVAVTIIGIMTRLDPFLLSLLRSETEVGWYGVALNIVLPFTFLPLAFSLSLFPHLSKQAVDLSGYINKASELSLKWILLIAVPIGVALLLFADVIVLTIFGDGFRGAIAPLRILGAGVVLIFANTVMYNILAAIDRQLWIAAILICELALAVILNLVLIPRFGIYGAALAVVGRDLVGLTLFLFALHRSGALRFPWVIMIRPLACGLITLGAMLLLGRFGYGWVLLGGVAVYPAALIATKTVDSADWRLAREIVRPWCKERTRGHWK